MSGLVWSRLLSRTLGRISKHLMAQHDRFKIYYSGESGLLYRFKWSERSTHTLLRGCALFSRRASQVGRAHPAFSGDCQEPTKAYCHQVSARLLNGRRSTQKGIAYLSKVISPLVDRPMAVSPATPEGSFVVEDVEDPAEPPMTSRDSGRSHPLTQRPHLCGSTRILVFICNVAPCVSCRREKAFYRGHG